MTHRILLSLLTLFLTLGIQAQGLVKGKVLDKNGNEPMSFVNVMVNRQSDGGFVKGGVTDEEGVYIIEELPDGQYSLVVSFVGYKEAKRSFSITTAKRQVNIPTVYLSEDARMLGEVTVTGQRSLVKLEVDRKTFDVSQDISNAGGSASDVLENIPSVEVDNDGNISLRGNSSVEVWINGKQSGLTADNRAQILEQLPAESIERIEVIDNPSAKFSAEGSAGIINIVLKKDRTAGYYGSLQVGANTRGGANASGNINYNSSLFDAYLNVGFRHRKGKGEGKSDQEYYNTDMFQHYRNLNENQGNNLFTRAGITWHATKKDDISLSGMLMTGARHERGNTPYHYGRLSTGEELYTMMRHTRGGGDMLMLNGEFNYRHNFTDKHFLDFVVSFNRWKSDNNNYYQDSTTYFYDELPTTYNYQWRPMHINNRNWEVKLDYENPITEQLRLQAGYQGRFSHENTPQESWADNTSWDGSNAVEDQAFYNRFIYDLDIHAFYTTLSYNVGKFGIMAGLRGEYWKVNTESYNWEQQHDKTLRDEPFKKDFFELFPSLFLSYQFTPTQQLQLNYTRRLRRPWGGELNSFRDTRDASQVSYGNPQLTPEFSNSFSLNYLKQWDAHSLLVSAYYRPTTDVIQRIRWQSNVDGVMYQTNYNVAKSQSTGLELVVKNKFFRRLDITTTANAYYYHIDGFTFYPADGDVVTGKKNHNFSWNARMQASLILPYDMTFQATGNYRARQVITQGYRRANYSVDLGLRKNFMNKKFTLAINVRDLFDTRRWRIVTKGDGFSRNMTWHRKAPNINATLTWNFGNTKAKKPKTDQQNGDDDDGNNGGYGNEMGE